MHRFGAWMLTMGAAPTIPSPYGHVTFEVTGAITYWDPADDTGLADDGNDGLTPATPVLTWGQAKTLAAAAGKVIDQMSDYLDFTVKQTCNIEGDSAGAYFLLRGYNGVVRKWRGTGAFWDDGTNVVEFRNATLRWIAIQNIHFSTDAANPTQGTSPKFVFQGTCAAGEGYILDNVLFERLEFHPQPWQTGSEVRVGDRLNQCTAWDNSYNSLNNEGGVGGYFRDCLDVIIREPIVGLTAARRGAEEKWMSHAFYIGDDDDNITIDGGFAYNIGWTGGGDGVHMRAGGTIRRMVVIHCSQGIAASGVGADCEVSQNYVSVGTWGGALGRAMALSGCVNLVVSENILAHATGAGNEAINLDINAITGAVHFSGTILWKWPDWEGLKITNSAQVGATFLIEDNDFHNAHSSTLVQIPNELATDPAFTFRNNTYNVVAASPFSDSGGARTFAYWATNVEPTATNGAVSYADPDKNIDDYALANSGGGTDADDLFVAMIEARKLGAGNMPDELRPLNVLNYFRACYGLAAVTISEEPDPGPVRSNTRVRAAGAAAARMRVVRVNRLG